MENGKFTGMIPNMPNEEYHSLTNYVSKSMLSTFKRSPYHFMNRRHEETPAMIKGSATHAYILEREKFDEEFVVAPKCDRRTKAGKAAWAGFIGRAGDRTVIDEKTFADIKKMDEAIKAHPFSSMLKGGVAEQSCFWKNPETGVMCKCRPDYHKDDVIIDLKTCQNAGTYPFRSAILKYGYDMQASFYSSGMVNLGYDISRFVFLAVEASYPYAVGVYEIDIESTLRAGKEITELLTLYKNCMKKDVWPMYNDNLVTVLSLPDYSNDVVSVPDSI